jgi:hypothetical protein
MAAASCLYAYQAHCQTYQPYSNLTGNKGGAIVLFLIDLVFIILLTQSISGNKDLNY